MTTVLNILVLIAAAVVPFWILLYLYGRIQKSMKKDHRPGAEPMNSGEDHAGGGEGGDGGGGDGSH